MRVAIASKDGISINEHFGHAKSFYVYNVTGEHCELMDQREVRHYCLGGTSDKTALPDIIETIKDCDAVFVAKIGDGPSEKLLARGIRAVDQYCYDAIQDSLIDYSITIAIND